jgi:tetratricopeptide (TPR) repeat protein
MSRIRQLTAIMFTDIQGYSTLMQQDETRAIEMRDQHREILNTTTKKFNGKILQYYGDGALSIFSSAVEAVQCGKELQLLYQQKPVIPVRIGIHLGDIIYTDDDVIGDGINLASCIKAEALPGSVFLSSKVFEEVKNQPDIDVNFVKSCHLKDHDQPVDVYALSNSGLVVPDLLKDQQGMALREKTPSNPFFQFWEELKRRKVIRVVTVYAAASYVMLELTSIIEEPLGLPDWSLKFLIVLLSIGFVLVATLSWVYDITPDGIRVTQSRTTTKKGSWPVEGPPVPDEADITSFKESRFSRKIFIRRILIPLLALVLVVLVIKNRERIFDKENDNRVLAREHVESAISYMQVGDAASAKDEIHLALLADSAYTKVWEVLAAISFAEDSFSLAIAQTLKAIEYDPSNSSAAYNLAIQSERRELLDQAMDWYQRAIGMDSTFAPAFSATGALYNKINRPIDAILILNKSLKYNPQSEYNYLIYKNLGESHFLLKEYDQALDYLERSKNLNPEFAETERCFARLYEGMGDTENGILHWQNYIEMEEDTLKISEAQDHLDRLRER